MGNDSCHVFESYNDDDIDGICLLQQLRILWFFSLKLTFCINLMNSLQLTSYITCASIEVIFYWWNSLVLKLWQWTQDGWNH